MQRNPFLTKFLTSTAVPSTLGSKIRMQSFKSKFKLVVALVIVSSVCFFQQPILGRPVGEEQQTSVKDAPALSPFQQKIQDLRQSLKPNSNHEKTIIHVDRGTLYEDALSRIMEMDSEMMRTQPFVIFKDEDGVDEGGLSRALFTLLSREITNPSRGLFTSSPDAGFAFQINPASKAFHEFRFVGRIFGMAILHDLMLGEQFVPTLFQIIQGQELTLMDMKSVDPRLQKTFFELSYDENIERIGLTMTRFALGDDPNEDLDLVPNGCNIVVTNSNKEEYIQLYVQSVMVTRYADQIKAIREGMYQVIPEEYLSRFQPCELALLISGRGGGLSVDELKELTTYFDEETEKHATVGMFWECVSGWTQAQVEELLEFVTGSPRVQPVEVRDPNGAVFVIRIAEEMTQMDHPIGHTCTKQIDVPAYTDPKTLCAKLEFSIENYGGGFFLE